MKSKQDNIIFLINLLITSCITDEHFLIFSHFATTFKFWKRTKTWPCREISSSTLSFTFIFKEIFWTISYIAKCISTPIIDHCTNTTKLKKNKNIYAMHNINFTNINFQKRNSQIIIIKNEQKIEDQWTIYYIPGDAKVLELDNDGVANTTTRKNITNVFLIFIFFVSVNFVVGKCWNALFIWFFVKICLKFI